MPVVFPDNPNRQPAKRPQQPAGGSPTYGFSRSASGLQGPWFRSRRGGNVRLNFDLFEVGSINTSLVVDLIAQSKRAPCT
jgi:hypothetical protein